MAVGSAFGMGRLTICEMRQCAASVPIGAQRREMRLPSADTYPQGGVSKWVCVRACGSG